MAAIQKKTLKIRVNISIDEELKDNCSKFAKERYNTSLSAVVTALLEDWNKVERNKKVSHPDQGALI